MPFDEVLTFSSLVAAASYLYPLVVNKRFDFVFRFAFDDIWWGTLEVGSVFFCFMIRGKEDGVKYVMNSSECFAMLSWYVRGPSFFVIQYGPLHFSLSFLEG